MMRYRFLPLALIGTVLAAGQSLADYPSELIPQTTAARHGLTRAWFTQIQLDRSRTRVAHIVLDGGTLFVQTDHAVLHAIDAETGQTLWEEQVGRRDHPSMAPAANTDYVAVVNGSYLYVVNRFNGKLLWKAQIDGAPGAGPALSDQRAYVPTVGGLVLSYRLKRTKAPRQQVRETSQQTATPKEASAEEKEAAEAERRESLRIEQEYIPPLACQSVGRALVQPIVTRQNEGEELAAWPTDRGFLFVGHIDRREEKHFTMLYRLEAAAGIVARPTYLPPDPQVLADSGILFVASRDGYVHALRERNGQLLWRFSTGEPLIEPAVVIGTRVYAATQPGGMYCLDAKTGAQQWWTPQVLQLIAASGQRVYVVDRLGRLVVLSAQTGARVDTLPVSPPEVRLVNDQTDRIYLATTTGLIQCLHEIEQSEPIHHRQQKQEEPGKPDTGQQGPEEPQQQQQPEAEPTPVGDNPFGGPGNPFN